MKYLSFTVLAVMIALSGCTSVPGVVHDAASVSSAVVNGGVSVGATALEGAANVVVNVGRDVSHTVSGVVHAIAPPFYYFP